MKIEGRDVIAIPMAYIDDFDRDAVEAMIKYGSTPQRSHSPFFTNVEHINQALSLPDVVSGSGATQTDDGRELDFRSLVGSSEEFGLLDGISPQFRATDDSYWHVHVDLALNKNRAGDAAGIAMGRETGAWEEFGTDALGSSYQRIVKRYEVPLVAQIVAEQGDQVYITSVARLILQLKQQRDFNITSFSFDGFQSADAMQQLALAGLVTNGMRIEDDGSITGMPKPFSVDRHPQPYRELLEAANDRRVDVARYPLLRKEFRALERQAPGQAPDHPVGGSKDVADPVAGVLGYLAVFGHAALTSGLEGRVFGREDLGLEPEEDYFGFGERVDSQWDPDPLGGDGTSFVLD